MIILHFDLQPQFKYMNYFIYTSHHFTPHGRYELNKLASLPMCGFIAQLVEHRTGIAEVTGSNPVEALIFSLLKIGKFTAMIILHFELVSVSANKIYLNKTSLALYSIEKRSLKRDSRHPLLSRYCSESDP